MVLNAKELEVNSLPNDQASDNEDNFNKDINKISGIWKIFQKSSAS